MKVAYLLGSLGRGGTETLILDIFRNIKKNQFDVIGFYRKKGALEQDFLHSGVPMLYLPNTKNYFKYLWNLRKAIVLNNIDIIHAQQPFDALNARLACIFKNKTVVLSHHGYHFGHDFLWMTVLRIILPLTSKNIFVSKTQMEFFIKKFHLKKRNQTFIYNGISFDKFISVNEPKLPKEVFRLKEALSLDNNCLLFGTVGNFNTGRDQLTLCRFIKLLIDNNILNFHFVFIGSYIGTESAYFEKCTSYCTQNSLNKYVTFLGQRSDVPSLLSQFDGFFYSTFHDTFGIAIVEAMAAGVPVFVNDWDVMKEISDNGKYVTLYNTGDENDLLQKFMLFLQDKKQFLRKSELASDYVREKFSIENHIENLKKEYLTLISK